MTRKPLIALNKLTEDWKENFIHVHMPWKISQLRAYIKYGTLDSKDRKIGAALDLSTSVAGRMLLEFLGIRLGGESLKKKTPTNHDIWIKHFDKEPVNIKAELKDEDQKVLIDFLHRSNKIAHVTYDFRMEDDGKRDGHESIPDAVRIIERLLKDHFYTPLGLELLDCDDLETMKR